MTTPVFHEYRSSAELAEALAGGVAAVLAGAIATRGIARLAVSGGSTPKPFLQRLSQTGIDWSDVEVMLVDERWVPETSARSNHAMVRGSLMQGAAAEARLLPFYTGHDTPEEALPILCDRYQRIGKPFDVVVLGMGTDGHTASFFPGAENLETMLDPAGDEPVAAVRANGAGEPRVTLTMSMLVDARMLALHIEGDAKRTVYQAALLDGPATELPIRAALRAKRDEPINVFWAP